MRRRARSLLVLALTLAGLSPAALALDMFVEIEGIPGTSSDPQHADWIEVDSFTWGISTAPDATTGRASGRPTPQSLLIRKVVDRASPKLYQACAQGQRFGKATLAVREAGDSPLDYLIVELGDVVVSAVSLDGDAAASPMEEISLLYSKIAWKYTETDATGKPSAEVTTNWDVAGSAPRAQAATRK